MKVYLNEVTGMADAIVSMFMSKRTWTRELEEDVRETCKIVLDNNGFIDVCEPSYKVNHDAVARFQKWVSSLLKFGTKHITMLRYIDISCTVEGLHRGAQDDFDSHAKRLENRIIRSSTRLAKFGNEKSEWYQDKIITTDEALGLLHFDLPEYIHVDSKKYVKVVNGYVLEEYKDNKDVLRGLYMLSIPSNFIFKCNLTEFAHIVKERDINSTANPELKQMIECIISELERNIGVDRQLMYEIKN